MFDREDVVFRDALDRAFHQMLYGEGGGPEIAGLYGGLRGSQSWDQHLRSAGRIDGIHMCINELHKLAREMSSDPQPHNQHDRSMN